LIRPVELTGSRSVKLVDGTSADKVFDMFVAARDGDLARVQKLVAAAPALAIVEYNYTPPIHFAVREGHLGLVEFPLDRGADLAYRSYPFGDSLLTMAEDREHGDVAELLRERLSRRFRLGAGTTRIIDSARDRDLAGVLAELERPRPSALMLPRQQRSTSSAPQRPSVLGVRPRT
jgi:ankyrin repeat protein